MIPPVLKVRLGEGSVKGVARTTRVSGGTTHRRSETGEPAIDPSTKDGGPGTPDRVRIRHARARRDPEEEPLPADRRWAAAAARDLAAKLEADPDGAARAQANLVTGTVGSLIRS